ncbi:hypothetical protein B9Z44_01820 [Limnohabitans curvus]|uniref:histidine kinase n=1 Tax=Limnohabitans curvus TaxID=323423 RepID=A0A315EKL2_9BURK|nr:CHASE2 domain-containing protein [Limnohabitans curvus]PUE58443.1 hypothetical protein B9Z44_01820 [Limnohabitans curvus]
MNKHTERKARLRREWWLTTAVALVMLALLVLGDLARPMGNVLYDHLMRLQGFRATQNIVIIAVDDRSLQELGGWPLQRSQYTELLKRLDDNCCRPKVIGLDLLFLDPSSDDLALAEAIKQHKAVLPLAFKVQEDSPSSLQAIDPVAPLNEAATLGHINLSFDTDGVIRGIHTHEQGWSHFALALHAKGENKNATSAQSGHYRRFRMVDPRVGFPMISLADALENNISRTLLKDKYVLIGVTAPSLGDRYPTLYSGKNNASTPGVAVLASVLNASLNEALIDEATPWTLFALTLIPMLLMLQSLVMLRPRQSLILAVLLIISGITTSYALLTFADYWVDPVPFVLIALLLQPLWAWRRLEAIVNLVQDKAADLRQFQPAERTSAAMKASREVVLQHAKLLDHAVASARSELDFLSVVIDEMPDTVLIFDTQGQLLLSNRKAQQLFDSSLITDCQLTEFAKRLQLPLRAFSNATDATQDSTQQTIFQLNTRLGLRDFFLKTTLLRAPSRSDLQLLIFTDITDLRQSQTQRDRALQFLSHDMRTPIASILSLTRTTTENTPEDTPREKIVSHAHTLLQMMDDFILTISAEASTYKVQPVLLDNLLNDSLEQVADLAEAKDIKLRDESEISDIFVMANTRLLVRALVNLLFNAIKFAPTKSAIRVQSRAQHSLETSSTQVTITISNTVEANADAHDLVPLMLGFGLGLDFVDNVIHKHHGVIARNIPNNGVATVQVTLPCEISLAQTHHL